MARQKTVLGLDIGTYSVKAVELTATDDEVAVTGVGWEKIPEPDLLEDTIYSVIANNSLNSKKVVTAVSGRSVIVRHVMMMQMAQEELQQAIRLEADKYIPYDLDDVQLDCQQLGDVAGGDQMRVLLVAAKREHIDSHLNMLRGINLRPFMIDVDVFAMANAFELCNAHNELASPEEAVALVDVGAAKTGICIMRGNSEYFTREVYSAGNAMTDAVAKRFNEDPLEVERMKEDPGEALNSMQEAMVPTFEELGNEIRLSFDYYENQFEQTVSKVYLSGGSILFPGVVEGLGHLVGIEAERFMPFETMNVQVSDDIIFNEKASDMVVALGLAARIKDLG